ncbi:MAG: peptidase S49 [Stutzerimonas stutzeri]|nr:MAG: peptidase S49 [Stutzerimonas stutzeri]
MTNPFLARFDNSVALIAPEMKGVFESCLQQTAQISKKLEADTSQPKMLDGDDFWFAADDWRATYRPYVVKNGILQIPVKGVLLHDFPWQFGGWATGYEYVWQAVKRGQADGNVRGIALICDTPGGMVAGCFEAVDRIHAVENRKPLRAYAMEMAYSAGYAIASVADSITVSRTGGVGSIGVVTMHADVSGAMDKMGVKITFIFAGEHKVDGNAYEALKPEVRERIQARVDEMYGVFVSTVARNRAMDEQAVRDTKALTFTATQAVSNGLADAIGSLDDAVAAYAADLDNEEESAMSGDNKAVDQAAANEANLASARTQGKNEGLKEGATAERARINAIIGSDEGKDRPKAALSAALKTDMTVEQATAFLGDLPKEDAAVAPKGEGKQEAKGTKTFEQAMDQSGNPDLGATAGQDESAKPSRADLAASMAFGARKTAA